MKLSFVKSAALGLLLAAVPASAQWLKIYPVPVYGAHWHIDVKVRSFEKARKKTLEILEKYGGTAHIPLENSAGGDTIKYQQFSFRLSRKNADKALKRIKKLGQVRRSDQREASLIDYSEEIGRKIDRLNAERKAGGELFNRLASVREIIEELLASLEASAAGYRSAKETVLLNIVLEETASR